MPALQWRRRVGLVFVTLCVVELVSAASRPCTSEDYHVLMSRCSLATFQRTYVSHLTGDCDPSLSSSVKPNTQPRSLPCECPAGLGLKLYRNESFTCEPCAPGTFSTGGELISDFNKWSGHHDLPGSGYSFMVSCGDPFMKTPCKSWRPGGNNRYLVSGDVANATASPNVNCFSHPIMATTRVFNAENSSVSFSYQVDAKLCMRNSKYCASGLYFFVDGKEVLHSDFQSRWRTFKLPLEKGAHIFKWVFRRSCSRVSSLNVAYVKNIAFVGTWYALSNCGECPTGTYSNSSGTETCTSCMPGQYQNETGMTSCKQCQDGYSRYGDNQCYPLPNCTAHSFSIVPDPVEKCSLKNGKYMRNQAVSVISIPGFKEQLCKQAPGMKFPTSIPCRCRSGYFLNVGKSPIVCEKCIEGQYSNGNSTSCSSCPKGHAIIPGLHFDDWSTTSLPKPLKAECSGEHCTGDGWVQSGSYIRTRRMSGNFETTLEITNLTVDHLDASISFNCSVYCNVGEDKAARTKNCYLRTVVMFGNKVIRDKDCVSYNIMSARNGTIRKHSLKLAEKGLYTFRWLFHHGDDANDTSMSYEARIYNISIVGTSIGSASSCTLCPAGSYLPPGKIACEKCPAGKYSAKGADKCTACTGNTFADKMGSKTCKPCGAGTIVNQTLTGCDLRGCRYTAGKGIVYDLLPLARIGGPMREVAPIKAGRTSWYQKHYYVNLCTKNHDNSSCYISERRRDETGKYVVVGQKVLKTYACRRWSFTTHYSYSLGSTMGFQTRTNPRSGINVILSQGYSCYNRYVRKLVPANTTIEMICDMSAGEGSPEPISNGTDIEVSTCAFKMRWRSVHACPLCTDEDYMEVRTPCVNGYQNSSFITKFSCFPQNKSKSKLPAKRIKCQGNTSGLGNNKDTHSSTKSLMAIVIICVVLSVILSVAVAVVLCKNRRLRRQLFNFHPTMTELQGETDYQELIADS